MKTIVKLTEKSVIGEIESVLDTYPYQPYQQAFAIPDLRQELISFVINHLPGFSSQRADNQMLLGENHKDSFLNHTLDRKISRNPLEQKLYLQNLIHQGIFAIIQAKADLISNQLCETVQPGCQSSHWFG
ncbi:hypothetical protein [Anabaena sp. UHCC 0451]|uniref:hypothetical protein n=1 Tax=Anabaena sp. UHCC 0451 TaxID=2055235 RepID=UPI002B21F568|nr:hypothetical protein [Anabaena sp. UHCC 0451]MEA5577610.1 hypothetical protein [Anabaena sp. UHCC 0451]